MNNNINTPGTQSIHDADERATGQRERDAYTAAKKSHRVTTKNALQSIQDELRVSSSTAQENGALEDLSKSTLRSCLRKATCNASKARSHYHLDPDEDGDNSKHKEKNDVIKTRVPHGPGTALFPVPRTDWEQKGQSNAADFGRLIVGDFHLWKTDFLDLCFTQ